MKIETKLEPDWFNSLIVKKALNLIVSLNGNFEPHNRKRKSEHYNLRAIYGEDRSLRLEHDFFLFQTTNQVKNFPPYLDLGGLSFTWLKIAICKVGLDL